MNGLITEIQRGSVHDGPGIRTVVFMKGCNLRCAWCHNPETIFCGEEILFDPAKCIHCGQCATGCFTGARVPCGKRITPEDALQIILEDKPYYGEQGGVTISGGEPILQTDFVCELLRLCRENGITTAIESNLSLPTERVQRVCSLCDLVMCDLKAMTPEIHQEFVGADNGQILKNMQAVSAMGVPMLVRTPVVKTVNASETEIASIASFLSGLPTLQCYELLTYHPLGLSKPKSEHFETRSFEKPTRDEMKRYAAAAAAFGIPVKVDNVVFHPTAAKAD